MKIYHNPRCSKSRQGLAILESSNLKFDVINYIKDPVSTDELKSLLHKLDIPAEALIRKNEAIWKQEYKHKQLSEEDLIAAMVAHPKLIERPIVVNGDKAVIGRPPEKIKEIL